MLNHNDPTYLWFAINNREFYIMTEVLSDLEEFRDFIQNQGEKYTVSQMDSLQTEQGLMYRIRVRINGPEDDTVTRLQNESFNTESWIRRHQDESLN